MQWLRGFLPILTALLMWVIGAIFFSHANAPFFSLLGAMRTIVCRFSSFKPTLLSSLNDFILSNAFIAPYVLLLPLCQSGRFLSIVFPFPLQHFYHTKALHRNVQLFLGISIAPILMKFVRKKGQQ